MLKHWTAEPKMGQSSTTDEPCSRCLTEVSTLETTEKICMSISTNCRVKVNKLAETVGILIEYMLSILYKHLCMTKLWTI